MIGQLLIRVVLGGAIVSVFSVVGELFRPKTFAGMFGAAPSVALASLALAFSEHGSDYVAIEARSMVVGAGALFLYAGACVFGTRRSHWPVWLSATLSWGVWFAAAFAVLFVGERTGALR
jgi:uncharacterized membrane protein (GlpM family)